MSESERLSEKQSAQVETGSAKANIEAASVKVDIEAALARVEAHVGLTERGLMPEATQTKVASEMSGLMEAISAGARANPLLAFAISAGVGLLLGRIMAQGLPGNPVSRPKKPPRLPW
jgi:ElaB/YqjD/DUF883 family membrane-anchored ribosome-binding protein